MRTFTHLRVVTYYWSYQMRELNVQELNVISGGMGPIDLTPLFAGLVGIGVIGGLILAGIGFCTYQFVTNYKVVHV